MITKKRIRNLAVLAGMVAVVKVVIIGKREEPIEPRWRWWAMDGGVRPDDDYPWRTSHLLDYEDESGLAPDKVEARA
jgi:hypothetical protein